MSLDAMPLARQVDLVFRELKEELSHLDSGTVFMQIRDNRIGKFGIRHEPVPYKEGVLQHSGRRLSETQVAMLRQFGVQALKMKHQWTHGEIEYEFALRKEQLVASVQFISNYNMANLRTTPSTNALLNRAAK